MSDPDDESEWKKDSNRHSELDLEDDLDPSLLMTNSRVNCYLSCRRQHNFKYNLGLVPVRENLPESLFLGTALHVALEHYWEAIKNAK
jgi:ATP-dependent helicase/DNAse subunit B